MASHLVAIQSLLGVKSTVFLPIPRGEKGPRLPGWQAKTLADMANPDYFNLFAENGNVGVLLGLPSNGLCVIDIDRDEWVAPFLALNPSLTETLRTRGSRGCSLWIRISGEYPKPGKIKDAKSDAVMEWRADGQQSVIHGQHPQGMPYQRIIEAPPIVVSFDEINWPVDLFLPLETSRQSNFSVPANAGNGTSSRASPSIIDNARKYIEKMPSAISGQNGHDQTLAVACALIKGFNLTVSDALPLLREYNVRCEPPWLDGDIERKLAEANRLPDNRQRGYLVSQEPSVNLGASHNRPIIKLPGGEITYSKSAQQIFSLIAPSRTMFIRGRRVVEMDDDSEGRYSLKIVTASAFRSRVESFGDLVAQRSGRRNDLVWKPTPMPEETAKGLLDTKESRELLPPITTIINCPVFIADIAVGRIIGKGYDPSGLFVTGGEIPPIVAINEAVNGLKEIIGEIDFVSPGDRSRAIASMLTPALKLGGHIRGFVPADVAEADQSQAGKTYRQRGLAAIYNEVPAIISKREGGVGSLDESIAQKLLSGTPFIQIDNVRGKLDSQYLESLLTSDKAFSVRIPHHGEVEIKPDGVFILLTSNGVETTPDFANRSNIIRIRKRIGHAYKVYSDGDLLDHVRSQQAYFLGCVFSVIREWIAQGRKRTSERGHDFREWVQILDWIIQNIFGEAPIMAGHQETKERISNPAMTFARKLALSIKDAGRLGEALCAAALYQHCEEDGIDIPGLSQPNQTSGQKQIGTLMGRIFQRGEIEDKVALDGFMIERTTRTKHDPVRQEYMQQKVYIFIADEVKYLQPELTPSPTHPT